MAIKNIKILAIESSCDETAAAVLKVNRGSFELLANVISSQIDIHRKYGGVVPEIAARQHAENIIPVIDEAFGAAKISPAEIDFIAVTAGPGLITSLLVGVETAKALSRAWDKPLLPVNHMYGHLAANFFNLDLPLAPSFIRQRRTSEQGGGNGAAPSFKQMNEKEFAFHFKLKEEKIGQEEKSRSIFPAVALVVSGGHTEIVLLQDYWRYEKIGQTVDDAVGEAFDKVAKLLGLGYPGGPIVSAKAAEFSGQPELVLPRPMLKSNNFDFSFSGLKTAILYKVQKMTSSEIKKRTPEICRAFQDASIEVLVSKTIKAARKNNARSILLAGGVAANKKLREELKLSAEKSGFNFFVPEFKLCTDNAAMIAVAAYFMSQKKKPAADGWKKIKVDPNWEL